MVEDNPYLGAEQRKDHRRVNKDQRLEIRFEPKKKDRRKDNGRRETDATPWDYKKKD